MGTFTWVGAEESEIVMLNDGCWRLSMIPWSDILQILRGDIVHLPAPKNLCSKDTPYFTTVDAPLVFVKGRSIDQANTQMTSVG